MSKQTVEDKLDVLLDEAKDLYSMVGESLGDEGILENLQGEEIEDLQLIYTDLKKIIKRLKPTRKVKDRTTGKIKVIPRKTTREFLKSTQKKIKDSSKDIEDIFDGFGSSSESE
jgi:hypothetical protein